jgi:transcriptional regulator with XRE-family HTH domain
MLHKFAEELKEIRKSKDLTLQQVAVKTKIDYKFLEAMEEGDFEFLPELYVRAFLREYIRILGADEQLYTKKYEAARQGKEYTVEPEIKETVTEIKKEIKEEPVKPEVQEQKQKLTSFEAIRNFKKHEETSSASRRRNKTVIYYLTAATIFFTGIIYLFLFSGTDNIIVPEKPWEEIIEDTYGRYDEEETIAAMSEVKGTDSLTLNIRALDTSWIRIRIDDSRTEEFILFPASQKSMKAAGNYKIIFGNARGVQLDFNGKPLSFNPRNSNVLRIQIDNSGIKELDQNTVIE